MTRATEMNVDQFQCNTINLNATSDTPTQAGQGHVQAETQLCAYFITTGDLGVNDLTYTKISCANASSK